MFQTKAVEKHILRTMTFFPENRDICEIRRKDILEPDSSQMTIWRTRIVCWVPKVTNTHPSHVISTYWFSTATMLSRTRLCVTLYVHCLSCLSFCTKKTPVRIYRVQHWKFPMAPVITSVSLLNQYLKFCS
jgi:hypothetical protein